jgi:RNA polymerase sigma-70 factor (ECF subfamily)
MSPKVVPFTRNKEPLSGRSDDDLMLLSSAGAREAFEELVREHARRVLGFCSKNAGSKTLGEEMAQEIWLSVWDHRRGYEPEGKFVVWLFTLARNRVRNARRDTARRTGASRAADAPREPADAPDLSPDGLDRMLVAERRARVERALTRVSAPLREAVVLRFAEDLSYDEIARVLATSETTARSRVFHGLR